VFGTPAYMPPEQARGDIAHIGTPADVYAIGAILYHVLSGCVPYGSLDERLDNVQVWRAVKERAPLPLSKVAAHAPAELVAICELAMRRDPRQRYASMQALADELRAYLENRVVHAYSSGPLVELRKWIARNRGTAAGLALSLLVTLGGVLVYAIKEAQRAQAEASGACCSPRRS
jgi:serine/threonine protein kinase